MSLSVALHHRQGDFDLDVAFCGETGVTALFGASGAGKSTVTDIIAGLKRPREGRIVLGDRVLVDTSTGRWVPPHRRRCGYVFQDSRLFPHLSVRKNLLYGHWFTPRAEQRDSLSHVVDLLDLAPLLGREISSLSGGERQRTALGRALLASPRLLLMDEPLAALDAPRKTEILPYLERLRDEAHIPIVYVSHEFAEVARLANTLVVLDRGRVAASGPITEIASSPPVAALMPQGEDGALLDGRVAAIEVADRLAHVETAAGTIRIAGLSRPVGAKIRLQVRAKDVMIAAERPAAISALNVLTAEIAGIADTGDGAEAVVTLHCQQARLLARVSRHSIAALGLASGGKVYAVVKSAAIASGLRAPFA